MKTDYKLKKSVQEEKDDRLVENFLTEINEIESFLEGREIEPEKHERVQL